MRFLSVVISVLFLPLQLHADVSARLMTVMVQNEDGSAKSTGALFSNGSGVAVVMPERMQEAGTLCIRIISDGKCHLIDDPLDLPGIDVVVSSAPLDFGVWQQEIMVLFQEGHGIAPWVSIENDSLTAAELTWIGRDEFSDWRRPLLPARAVSLSETGFTIGHDDLGPLDEGAIVFDPAQGLVGLVVRAENGRAGVVGSDVLFGALVEAGISIPLDQRPTRRSSVLPPAVEAEIGGFWTLHHYPSQPIGFAVFYGPSSNGGYAGWGANFDTTVFYNVYSLDQHMSDGLLPLDYLSGSESRQTYGGSGWSLGAPYASATPSVLAACVIHAVPSGSDKRIFNLSFWRHRGDRVFEQVAFPDKGWASEGDDCLTEITRLGDLRPIINGVQERHEQTYQIAPPSYEFEVLSDPVSPNPSAIVRLEDLEFGMTCGPGNVPYVFFRSDSGDAPHIMVDVYRANLEDWALKKGDASKSYLSPMHPEAARGAIYGAGLAITYQGSTQIIMGGQTSPSTERALASCL